ncbi:hypothetical protein BJ138DRAFT_1168532 [Hygrophoropsis aurantiaca]|uniref:Uncharacterized protein n=1 Tax=Hygrophoropsis aurantiaca TaxID=72124 RepID=A0ACB7ZQM2_9AGAM|nr:hypothetical protein BJ138DRAFT_1168532 [Hygrophoropsis aurantiaca]
MATINLLVHPDFFAECDAISKLQPDSSEGHWKVILACMAGIQAMLSPDSDLNKRPDIGYIMGVANARSYEKVVERLSQMKPNSSAFFTTPDMPDHIAAMMNPLASSSPYMVGLTTVPATLGKRFKHRNPDTSEIEDITIMDFGMSHQRSSGWRGTTRI